MEYRRLGRSGLQVSELSFGSWVTFGDQRGLDVAKQLMVCAYDNGINFFDNAEGYSQGQSEVLMGTILKEMGWRRDSYIVSSKVFFGSVHNPLPTQCGLSRKHVVEACHQALERLQVEYLDLYFCHRPDPATPIEETVWVMNDLIRQGKVLYWGTSEWGADDILEAHRVAVRDHLVPPTMEQPQYNMFSREKVERDYLPVYDTVGIGTTIWSPLASGVLSGKYNNGIPKDSRLALSGYKWLQDLVVNSEQDLFGTVKKIHALCAELGVDPIGFAIAWCLHNPHVSTVILGASQPQQLQHNINAAGEAVSIFENKEVVPKLESILNNKP